MTDRSPSAHRICAAALEHFAERGYDGASLNEVAEMVGMRKASLYAHFKNKDALFLEVLADAVAAEQEFAQACFNTKTGKQLPGAKYCSALAEHHSTSAHFRFLLRTAFGPTLTLKAIIGLQYEALLQHIGELFATQLNKQLFAENLPAAKLRHYAQAYVGIIESLYVELIYTEGTALEARRKALWGLMQDSLQLAQTTQPVAK